MKERTRILFGVEDDHVVVVPFESSLHIPGRSGNYHSVPDPEKLYVRLTEEHHKFVNGGEEHWVGYGIYGDYGELVYREKTDREEDLDPSKLDPINLPRYFRALELVRRAREVNPSDYLITSCIFYGASKKVLDPNRLFSPNEDLGDTFLRDLKMVAKTLGGGSIAMQIIDEIARMPVPDFSEAIKSCQDFSISYDTSELLI